jgi:endoglucanase
MLLRTWDWYRGYYIDGGRVVDRGAGDITTSEGQAYAMLRAVYADDRATFDRVWSWTKTNLQVRGDGLLSWRWGPLPDGSLGLLERGSATDAEQDAALALLFASRQWHDPAYQQEALTILRAVWQQETAEVAGRRYLVAGDWARGDGTTRAATVNPSYFAPYAYRIFAEADPERDWLSLVDSSYEVLAGIAATPELGGDAGVVPNWITLDIATGAPSPAPEFGDYANELSFDASRTPWRVAVDWLWFQDPRSFEALQRFTFVQREIENNDNRIQAAYRMNGSRNADYEAISMYAGVIPALFAADKPTMAQRAFGEHILRRYVEGGGGPYWGDQNNYYDQNWAWFTTALFDGSFSNLWDGQQTIDWASSPTLAAYTGPPAGTTPTASPPGVTTPDTTDDPAPGATSDASAGDGPRERISPAALTRTYPTPSAQQIAQAARSPGGATNGSGIGPPLDDER